MIKKNKRNDFLDIVKAFAIISVVLGHCIQYGSGNNFFINNLYFENFLFKFIYSFHMPLFILISGYLFAFSIKKDWKELIKNKINTLLIPIICWAFIPWIITILKTFFSNTSVSLFFILKSYLLSFLGNLWFLWAVFLCSFIVIIVNHFFKDSVYIYLFGFIITFFIPDIALLYVYKFMYLYFMLGYFANIKKVNFNKYFNIRNYILITLIFFSLLLIYNYDSFIYTTKYYIFNGNMWYQLYIDLYRYIIGFFGSLWFLYSLKYIYPYINGRIKSFLIYIGKNTIGIYIISGFIFSYIFNIILGNISRINYFLILVESICVIFVSLLFTYLIKKVRILNKLLFGGR